MQPLRLAVVFFLMSSLCRSQEVQWASKLIGFSSEFQAEIYGQEFRATQVLGKPNTVPPFGRHDCAWSPSGYNTYETDWIEVGFNKPQVSRQLVIVENSNPGNIGRVVVYDINQKKYLINVKSKPSRRGGKIQYIALPDSGIIVQSVKVMINNSRTDKYQIDAIGLCEQKEKIVLKINVAEDAPKKSIKERLENGVNTKEIEVGPLVTADGKTLYYTRGDDEATGNKQEIWTAKIDESGFKEVQNAGKPFNNSFNNAVVGISPDGKKLYLMNCYLPNGNMTYGASKSTNTNGVWTYPSELVIESNNNKNPNDSFNIAKFNNADYTFNPDGNVLILSIKQKNTFGGRDLYISFQKKDSTWSKPLNLGNTLNTAATESCPIIAYDNKTMYFCSYGHPGYGSGDIFITRRLDDTWLRWSEPENLGPAINTNKWEGYFSTSADGDVAYMVSNFYQKNEDIYRVKPYESIKPIPVILKADTLRKDTIVVQKAKIEPEKLKELPNILTIELNDQNRYNIVVSANEVQRMIAEGYFTEEVKKYFDTSKNGYVIPLKEGQKISMGNAMFEQSKFTLLSSAIPVLDKIGEMMLKSPVMEFLVEGHTDNLGDFDLNLKLSQDRVNEVKIYLESKGISAQRIQTKAWGPSKPRASNESEESRKKNRRVEFTVLKM